MSTLSCAACTTVYAADLDTCPHCGSVEYTQDGGVIARRLPAFVSLTCACGRGPWQYRLPVVASGLIQLAPLFCASCGSQVQIPWPPTEDSMPKISKKSGPTNARDTEPSPDVDASQPLLVGAEADQEGRPAPFVAEPESEPVVTSGQDSPEAEDAESAPDYDGMTLAELREEANRRNLPSYGTKAQITERLREDDLDEE